MDVSAVDHQVVFTARNTASLQSPSQPVDLRYQAHAYSATTQRVHYHLLCRHHHHHIISETLLSFSNICSPTITTQNDRARREAASASGTSAVFVGSGATRRTQLPTTSRPGFPTPFARVEYPTFSSRTCTTWGARTIAKWVPK